MITFQIVTRQRQYPFHLKITHKGYQCSGRFIWDSYSERYHAEVYFSRSLSDIYLTDRVFGTKCLEGESWEAIVNLNRTNYSLPSFKNLYLAYLAASKCLLFKIKRFIL